MAGASTRLVHACRKPMDRPMHGGLGDGTVGLQKWAEVVGNAFLTPKLSHASQVQNFSSLFEGEFNGDPQGNL